MNRHFTYLAGGERKITPEETGKPTYFFVDFARNRGLQNLLAAKLTLDPEVNFNAVNGNNKTDFNSLPTNSYFIFSITNNNDVELLGKYLPVIEGNRFKVAIITNSNEEGYEKIIKENYKDINPNMVITSITNLNSFTFC